MIITVVITILVVVSILKVKKKDMVEHGIGYENPLHLISGLKLPENLNSPARFV